MKKIIKKLPLFLGIGVLVVSIMVSAASVGQKKSVARTVSQASEEQVKLSLIFTDPDIISVILSSPKPVLGADVVLSYDKSAVTILPSTLTGGSLFTVGSGLTDEEKGVFKFSAAAKDQPASSGILTTFRIQKKEGFTGDTTIDFDESDQGTTVLEKDSFQNILSTTEGITISF